MRADRAGIRAGDVITHLGRAAVSDTGQYDDPVYGKTSIVHLIRSVYQVGQQIPVGLYRKGDRITLPVTLDHRRPGEYLVPPYIIDRAPAYYIVGGLLLEELSQSYLREYGKDWNSQAPVHLLFYNQNQDYLNGDQRKKIVIIPGVIPTPYTTGYENIGNAVVLRINGRDIDQLADVPPALESPLDGFHKIEIEQHPYVLYLDAAELPAIHDTIEKRYRIPVPPLP